MIHRRDAMLRLGRIGGGALSLPLLLQADRARAAAPDRAAPGDPPAKSCILIYLWGGPPQQDMWDLKPEAPDGIRSEFQPIDTVVPGMQVADAMPQLARQTDKLCIVRSLTHESNLHEPSVYHTLTGRVNPTLVVPRNQCSRRDFPNVEGVVSYFTPPGGMPAAVTIPKPIGHDGVTYAGTHAGFLGPKYDPLETSVPDEVDAVPTHRLDLPEGISLDRIAARRGLLSALETLDRALDRGSTASLDDFRAQAFRMLTDPRARGALDLAREPDAVRERYGRNEYGESFLLARRLVEAGVRLVTFVWEYTCPDGNVANVWDNHGGTASLGGISGFDMLRQYYCIPSLDQGLSALLEDLDQRGMLDETLVAAYGEFGRTPKINKEAGRDHWGMCQSVALAGGGIRGGQIYGASDKHAAYPADNPISPQDLLATIYHALGINPQAELHDAQNRPYRVCDGRVIGELLG